MITLLKNPLKRFRKEEAGSVYTIEFVLMLPILFVTFLFGIELTTYSNRQFQLDRGLEVTTRLVRLTTGRFITHDDLTKAICDNSGGLANCETMLRLEMVPMNPRQFSGLPAMPDCTSAPFPVNPVRGWSLGQQHELMLLRACYKFTPVVASVGLGKLLGADSDGMGRMVSISAFVQEPE
ncbi:pilus assembly protein [Sulfitobacter sp. F26169L]|uniref:TadE/TadG family type IV pilus assembly protein n=1 Tax=Sulfitobacter sp. F26169L TaxID=2996015 RepID=UPI002260FABF|nr:pilus assembly protein [Sulfitobacter sp. F26169L]MCX7566436.1 pilus assembly protein [Sulfitobacter sp. F26169L]